MQTKREAFEKMVRLDLTDQGASGYLDMIRLIMQAFDVHVDQVLRNSFVEEPVFVLRAQDQTAVDTIKGWLEENNLAIWEKHFSATERLVEFKGWQSRNKVKQAD
jgi:hypothetical protein